MPAWLTAARRFAIFHGVEPGNSPQSFSFNNSYVWGDLGIGPGSVTNFSGGSSLIGDCVEQPPASDPTKGCRDVEEHNTWSRNPATYRNFVEDLAPIVTDIRSTIDAVRAAPATQSVPGDLAAGTTISSAACGSLNIIRVTGKAIGGITVSGCPTDYFIFDVAGQYLGSNGQTDLSGVPASNILWVFGGRLQNSGTNGIRGTALFDQPAANNAADNMKSFDGAVYILNGKLSLVSGGRVRWNPFTVYDYGDAPASYGTSYSSLGGAARHRIVPDGPSLGRPPSGETDGQPTSAAASDTDDGVVSSLAFSPGQTAVADVVANNPSGVTATIKCWMDLNGDGSFSASEAQTAAVAAGASDVAVHLSFGTLTAPAGPDTYLRCRISTDGAAISLPVTPIPAVAPIAGGNDPYFPYAKSSYRPNDQWPDGEVEDFSVRTNLPAAPGGATTTAPSTTTPSATTTTAPATTLAATTTTVTPTSTTTSTVAPTATTTTLAPTTSSAPATTVVTPVSIATTTTTIRRTFPPT